MDEDVMCKAFWTWWCYPFHTSSYFVRRDVVDRLLTDKTSTFSFFNEDTNIMRASFCEGKFYYISEIMSKRRLFAIGSWTSRQRQLSREEKAEDAKKQLQGETAFNRYTNYKYEDYIKVTMARWILVWSRYDLYNARNQLVKNEIRCDVFDEVEFDHKMMIKAQLICLMYFPGVLRVVHWIKDREWL